MLNLISAWEDYKSNPNAKPQLTYRYMVAEAAFMHAITEALVFWSFVRKQLSKKNRKDFCRNFLNDNNRFIKIIAHIEILPDKVWRKILWVENIDFMSYESTLRRLTDEQEEAIIEAATALENPDPRVPKVYMKSIFGFLGVWFGFINAQYLLTGFYGKKWRWNSKGAWAFNLLNMDFGFSLYPQGVDNDIQITNKKYSRFLSIKEHINDFIVNQESGLYWLLYRKARSNYVWFPNEKVELKTHVCPGFWATLIVHLWFWVLSPILFIISVRNWIDAGMYFSPGTVFSVTVSFLTPLWIIVASVKVFGTYLIKILKKNLPSIGNAVEVSVNFISDLFAPFFNAINWNKVGKFFKYTGYLVGAGVIVFLLYYIRQTIFKFLQFLLGVLEYIFNIMISYPISFTWGVLALAVLILSFYIIFSTGLDEKEYAKRDKVIRKFFGIWFASSVLLGYFTVSFEGTPFLDGHSEYSAYWALILNTFAVFVSFPLYLMSGSINMETIDVRVAADNKAHNMRFILEYESKEMRLIAKKFKRYIMLNDWLAKMSEDIYQDTIYVLRDISKKNYLLTSSERNKFFDLVIPVANDELISKLKTKLPKNLMYSPYKLYFIEQLCAGMSHGDAIRATKKKIEISIKALEDKFRREEKWDAFFESFVSGFDKWISVPLSYFFKVFLVKYLVVPVKKILNFVYWPFKMLFKGFAFLGRVLYRFFSTLIDLWELFNERCPYISKSTPLE